MNKNFANKRSEVAFKQVSEVAPNSFQKYRSLVRSLPATILNSGYGLAMASLYSNYSKNESKALYDHIEVWLKDQQMLPNNSQNLMENIAESDKDTYRLLESETLALLEWLKRFAEGASIS